MEMPSLITSLQSSWEDTLLVIILLVCDIVCLQSDRIIKHVESNLEQPLKNLDLKVEKEDEKKDDKERESDNDVDHYVAETTTTRRRKIRTRMMVKT